jgi:hypothetical protein
MPYCTIDDLRDEGYEKCDFSDRRVEKALASATATIERLTGRWFEPRELTVVVDGYATFQQLLELPLIKVWELRFQANDGSAEELVDPLDYAVYNRHVAQGLTQPDDRDNPRITFKKFENEIYHHPVAGGAAAFPEFSRFFASNFQNVKVLGHFGFTDPDFTHGRAIATNAGDAITATSRIKMVLGLFTSVDLGSRITLAGAGANDGTYTIRRIVSTTEIDVEETTLVAGVAGFTATIAQFPQAGITPPEIERACMLLTAKRLVSRAEADPLEEALASGRVRQMSVRDQSISLAGDSRIESGEASLTGDPEIDSILVQYTRPPRLGAA